jgi:signal transduction histidine kinase
MAIFNGWKGRASGNTLMFAVVTLALVGLALVFSTWQNLRQEQQISLQYLAMGARSVAQTTGTAFHRFLRMEGHRGWGAEGQEGRFWSRMGSLFAETEGESEVMFIALIDENGRSIFETRKDESAYSDLPCLRQPELSRRAGAGEWYGLESPGGEEGSLFVYAKAMRAFGGGRHNRMSLPGETTVYMVVGLSTEHYQALYRSFRNNALLQSAYVLAAAVFTWLLALRFMARRTRLHELEKNLSEAEKKAAVGALAAGVAHEIRNPLAALRGFAQYFAKKFSGALPDEEYAGIMVREADRLNRVITDLLYLARDKVVEKRPVEVERLIAEVTQLLRFDLEAKQADLLPDVRLGLILADADSLKQALLNLVLNSLDAFEEDAFGEGAPPEAQKRVIRIGSAKSEGWELLEVEDNGKGMTLEQKNKAFDAFFTGKAKGTGLGLSLVDKIMREHGGKVLITSEPGRGCKVSLYFAPAG